MRSPLRLKQWVGSYVVVEFVGQHESTALYLAAQDKSGALFWLLSSEQSLADLTEHLPQRELLSLQGETFAAIPLAAAPLATLAGFVRVFDLAFIGWRWAGLAESLHQLHAQHETYQRVNTFALDHFFFNDATQIVPASSTSTGLMDFPAPEAPAALSPASDVWALGAALLMLLGERAPDQLVTRAQPTTGGVVAERAGLWPVLRKATEHDPAKRYPHGHAFADALLKVVPPPRTIEVENAAPVTPAERGGVFSLMDSVLMAAGPVLIFVALVAGLYFLLKSTIGLPFDPLAALGNFNPLNNAPGAGAPPARRGTPRPLPQGALAISAFDLDVAANCTARLNLQLTKGAQKLASDAAVEFALSANAQAIPQVTVAPGATSEFEWQLIFRADSLCAGGGTLNVQAKAGDSAQDITLCYAGSTATEPPNSSQLSASGVQVRTDAYPELKASFSVVDAQNAAVHLPRAVQCTLQQDGQPVPEFVFTPIENADDPVTVALVFDVSGSMQGQPIANARAAATTFVQQLAANNPVCVYAFSTAITRLQTCTTDRKAMSAAIGKLNAGGDTALYDALLRVSGDQRKQGGRQVVIVLSDGADTASHAKLADALAQLQQANLPVYAIALVSKDFNGAVLKQIAQTTGASYLETPTSADLDKLYPLIQGQLRTQYGIRFTSRFPERRSGTLAVQLSAAGTHIQFQYPFFVQGP